MDDLEFNEFYKALQSQYQALFDRAQDECWLICVPQSSSLPSKSHITYSFAEEHLLEPSKMLINEYASLVGGKHVCWKLEGAKLKCEDRKLTVDVLTEELAYNKRYNQYRLFVVSSPLTGAGHQQRRERGVAKEDLLGPRRTLQDHLRLLQCFSKHQQIYEELDKRLCMFNKNYMILEDFLKDASHRLEVLLKNGYSSYVLEHPNDDRVKDRRIQEVIWVAVERLIIHSVHPKVYPMVCGKYQKEDRQFADRCRQLKLSFTPSVITVPSDYKCQYPITIASLKKLPQNEFPLDKLYCLQDAMDSIYKDVSVHFKTRLRIGEPTLLQSDDLIPLLATIIVQANLKMFVSDINYVEMFHWSPSDSNKLSYVLVTMRASLEYIKGPDVQCYLSRPSPSQPRSTAPSLKSFSSPSFSSPLLDCHDDETDISHTLSRLAGLKVKADKLENKQNTSNELGPFFGNLGDGMVSSNHFYDKP